MKKQRGERKGRKKKNKINMRHAAKTNQVFKRIKTNSQFTLVFIIEEQNTHFFPPFLQSPDLVVFFLYFARSVSRRFGRQPKLENAMHSPRTRRPTVLDTITLKYRPGSAEPNARLYARAASRPGTNAPCKKCYSRKSSSS